MDIRSGHSMSCLVSVGAFHVHSSLLVQSLCISATIDKLPMYPQIWHDIIWYLFISVYVAWFLPISGLMFLWFSIDLHDSARLMGLGIANFVGAFFGAVPTQIGLSRTSMQRRVMTRCGKRSINTSWTFHWPWKMVHSGIGHSDRSDQNHGIDSV